MRRTKALSGWVVALSVAFFMFLLSVGNFVYSAEIVPFGEVNVKLYVVALDGVNGHGVDNVTMMVEGILEASRVNATHSRLSPLFELKFGEIKIHTNVTVIHGWNKYKEIVETCSKAIIVNAHGESVPVPLGYTKEEWVDKIAEAMAYRNVTWVHTAGYPFYYYYHQESGAGEWGEGGFKQLMVHMGKDNITCHCPDYETRQIGLDLDAVFGMASDWVGFHDAFWVGRGKPLKVSKFEDCLVLPIWGATGEEAYLTGAVIKFAKANETHSFGFYVHIGTYQTYEYDGEVLTNADYWRGYAGAAAAICACSRRVASEEAILDAEGAIIRAENEGRTKGISEARRLLRQAKEDYTLSHYVSALKNVNNAVKAANNAIKPSFVEAYALPLAVVSVVGIATATSLVVKWKKNSKKENEPK